MALLFSFSHTLCHAKVCLRHVAVHQNCCAEQSECQESKCADNCHSSKCLDCESDCQLAQSFILPTEDKVAKSALKSIVAFVMVFYNQQLTPSDGDEKYFQQKNSIIHKAWDNYALFYAPNSPPI